MDFSTNTIHQGDCVNGLGKLPGQVIDLAFADPPFNIGYDYDVYEDKKHYDAYLDWTKAWMSQVCRVLKPTGTFWVAIGDEYAAEVKLIGQRDLELSCRSWVIWYYTFGVNCTRKFTRSHAHLFHFVRNPNQFTFNEDEIAVPSARQLVYADRRALPGGRLPDDTWILRPQDVVNGFRATESTWYFPRVAGTFQERTGFHGCQMPEQLLGRIIRTCSNPGEIILDPFAGSGTTLVVAKKLGRQWLGFELSGEYTKQGLARVSGARQGQPLKGAPEPVVSAPRTPGRSTRVWLKSGISRALIEAYQAARKGWSLDRVLADPELNDKFCKKCKWFGLPGQAVDWNLRLLALRKAGKLKGVSKARRTTFSEEQMDRYLFASEIAMQKMLNETGLSLDYIMCDPDRAKEFDAIASRFAAGFSSLQYRWAALTIRKRAHDCRERSQILPADLAGRRFPEFLPLEGIGIGPLVGTPGVYLARKDENQNLYVGESFDLGQRFEQSQRAEAWPRDIQIGVIELEGVSLEDRWGLKSRLITKYNPDLNYKELATIL